MHWRTAHSHLSTDQRLDRWDVISGVVLALLCAMLYGQVHHFALVALDDIYFISLNEQVVTGLSWHNIEWAFKTAYMGIWHPLTWLSYQIESSLFGADNNSVRHIANLCLHIVVTCLVYAILRLLAKKRLLALLLAVLFAVHPQHVQVLAWVSERKELLAALFCFTAFYLYLVLVTLTLSISLQTKLNKATLKKTKGKQTIGIVLLYSAALMSKYSAMPLAFVIMFDDLLQTLNQKGETRQALWQRVKAQLSLYLPLLFLAIAATLLTLYTQQKHKPELIAAPIDGVMSLRIWLEMIVLGLGHYLQTFIMPWPLPLLIERPDEILWSTLIKSGLWIAGFAAIWCRFWRNRLVSLGAVWFLFFWLPTSGVVPIGPIYVADRYMYQAHLGLLLMLLGMMNQFANSAGVYSPSLERVGYIILCVAIVCFAALSQQQARHWQNSITLFEHEMRVNPDSVLAPIYIGWAYQQQKNYPAAMQAFEQAIEVRPDDYYAYAYKGFLAQEMGDLETAKGAYQTAMQYGRKTSHHYLLRVYESLAWVYYSQGRYRSASKVVERGMKLFPRSEYLPSLRDNLQQQSQFK